MERQTDRRRGSKRRRDGWHDGRADGRVRAEVLSVDGDVEIFIDPLKVFKSDLKNDYDIFHSCY